MTSRDDAVQTLSAILGGGDLTEEENAAYTMEAVNLSQLSESESKVESLIRAQGFEDCVVYLDGETASIVVKSEGLAAEQAAQIKDILLKSDTLRTSAKNNTVANFRFPYFEEIDKALIEGLGQNQDFFSLLLKNEDIKKEVLSIFTDEIYKALRQQETNEQ